MYSRLSTIEVSLYDIFRICWSPQLLVAPWPPIGLHAIYHPRLGQPQKGELVDNLQGMRRDLCP